MKTIKLVFFFCFLSLDAFAGPITSGGGDPDAFVFVARLTQAARMLSMSSHQLKVDPGVLLEAANEILSSLDSADTSKHLIEFVNEPMVIEGISKPGAFDAKSGRIRIHRSIWLGYESKGRTDKQRALAVMEAMLLKGILKDRYSTAGSLLLIAEEAVENFATAFGDNRRQIAIKDCDTSIIFQPNDEQTASVQQRSSSLNFFWKANERLFILNAYFPELEQPNTQPLSTQAVSYPLVVDGKAQLMDEARLVLLDGRKKIKVEDFKSIRKNSMEEANSNSETKVSSLSFYRRPDGGLMSETRFSEGKDIKGGRILDKLQTCSYRFLSSEWESHAPSVRTKSKIQKFDQQISRLQVAEGALTRCMNSKEQCKLEQEHLKKIEDRTIREWRTLFESSDFSQHSPQLASRVIREHRKKDLMRWEDPSNRSRWRESNRLSPEAERALDRGLARSRLQDCQLGIARGNTSSCDFSGLEDVLFPSNSLR